MVVSFFAGVGNIFHTLPQGAQNYETGPGSPLNSLNSYVPILAP